MANETETRVAQFFDEVGWQVSDGVTEDARRWEDLREHAREYGRLCRLRPLRHIPARGVYMLDVGSGPIQFDEYVAYSANFTKRYCVDLSGTALEAAQARIGDHGVYLRGSIFDVDLPDNFFDCSICIKTLFNIDKARQEDAVRKLLRVTKPGRPVIITYANPKASYLQHWFLPKPPKRERSRAVAAKPIRSNFSIFPTEWWQRFNDVAKITLYPAYSFPPQVQKALIPDTELGGKLLDRLFKLEERFPTFFVSHFHGILAVLIKR